MSSTVSRLVENLRNTRLFQDSADRTDGELLDQFLHQRSESALNALVFRHGPMVWGVCRRVLNNHHDAEDAFQATFLVLVRRADAIVPREMVGNFLYGVAHQTARKARASSAKRRNRETQVREMPEPAAKAAPDSWGELQPLLDQELGRLPDKYRAVLVLSDLEGKTRSEVARELTLAEGTVASRLARGRALLARRLEGRGVALASGALLLVLSKSAATASVPPALLAATRQAMALTALDGVGMAGGSVRVVALANAVVQASVMAKVRTAFAACLVVLLLVVGVGAGVALQQPPERREPRVASPAAVPRRVVLTDQERLRGDWRAVRMDLRGETMELSRANGTIYRFGATDVVVARPAGRGGPWVGMDWEHRKMLRERVQTDPSGTARVRFLVRLDEKTRTIDRWLVEDGVEAFVVRGVYALTGDTLQIWEAAPMQQRPTPEQIQSGQEVLRWTFQRVGP